MSRLVRIVWWLPIIVLVSLGAAAADERLIDRDPFDRITLEDADGSVIEVVPLELPGRRLPTNPRRLDKLIVRLVDRPGEEFELLWRDVRQIDLFEQIVLDEANRLLSEGRLDEAYAYFDFLKRNHPEWPGLDESVQHFLFADARQLADGGRYENALASLLELHRLNAAYAGLPALMGAVVRQLVDRQIAQDDFIAARRELNVLAARFPNEPSVGAVTRELRAEAERLVAVAREQASDGAEAAARDIVVRALSLAPDLEATAELYAEINARYPVAPVGVTTPASGPPRWRIANWAARRAGRLLHRTLFELTGYGAEGGQYACPLGEAAWSNLRRRLSIDLTPNIIWSDGRGALTGLDVSRDLMAMTDPSTPEYDPAWSALFASATVRDVYRAEIDLARVHVRPEALLRVELHPWQAPSAPADEPAAAIGPYRRVSQDGTETVYLTNDEYFARGPSQPRYVAERYYAKTSEAIAALRRGEIMILDRLNPWDLAELDRSPELVVRRYAVPTVHCLLPNYEKPLPSNRTFRRALVYGINRTRILNDRLLRRAEIPGCQVASGPVPRGYAYDMQVEPRPYEPRVAMSLLSVVRSERAKAQGGTASSERAERGTLAADLDAPLPPIVLAHPVDEIAREACQAIRDQLAPLGVSVALREIDPFSLGDPPPDYDLLYVELAMAEPLVDLPRLLGPGGLTASPSPYLALALRQLQATGDWPAARLKLLEIHRLAHDELTVIPLWQLTDYFCYHRAVEGIGADDPVLLYQNVEGWRIGLWSPEP